MRFFLTGGTGFVGSYFTRRLIQMGHDVTLVIRSARKGLDLPPGVAIIEANPTRSGHWQERVPGHDVIVNLAGASIFTLWTRGVRETIMQSRVLTTRHLVDALAGSPADVLLLSASAVGYYGGWDDDRILDESSPAGDDFLAEVGRNWEAEASRAGAFGVRVVPCRFGIVLGRNGGALEKMAPAFRYFLGSPLGSGRQWFPWIHQEDLLQIMLFLAERKTVSGPVNCVSPQPVRNKELTGTLAEVLHRPLIMPSVPAFLLKAVLGEFGAVLLEGQRAVPRRLLDEGFRFRFPTLREALEDLLS